MFGKRYKGMYYFLQLVPKSKIRDVREKWKERWLSWLYCRCMETIWTLLNNWGYSILQYSLSMTTIMAEWIMIFQLLWDIALTTFLNMDCISNGTWWRLFPYPKLLNSLLLFIFEEYVKATQVESNNHVKLNPNSYLRILRAYRAGWSPWHYGNSSNLGHPELYSKEHE